MMGHLLTAFIDGLRPESIECMPFVNSLEKRRPIHTELGYSNTCHASMYTGVYPEDHLVWFMWQRRPDTSPYKWTKKWKLSGFPEIDLLKYASYRVVRKFGPKNTSFFRIPFITSTPFKYWNLFDVTEKRYWDEDGFVPGYPSAFEILRERNIEYDVLGMVRKGAANSSQIIQQQAIENPKPWTYLFFGDIDPMSHDYRQDSRECTSRLAFIDDVIRDKYEALEKCCDDLTFFLFSDHGHVDVTNEIDIRKTFRELGENIDDFVYFIDSTFARFWVENEEEERRILKTLGKLELGMVLTEKDLERYHITMPDSRYGDIIYSLDAPNIFQKPFSPFLRFRNKKKTLSMHGFRPEEKGMDGVFVANKSSIDRDHIRLEDILPTILKGLGTRVPEHIRGKSLWR